jgi:single-strand DNA-binding protein
MYQKITLVGRLGRDPEMRFLPDGKPVTSLNLAVNSYGQETMWVKVSVWGKQAENATSLLRKGSLVLVEGTLRFDKDTGGPRMWTSNSGEARTSFEVNTYGFQALSDYGNRQKEGPKDELDDDIPF